MYNAKTKLFKRSDDKDCVVLIILDVIKNQFTRIINIYNDILNNETDEDKKKKIIKIIEKIEKKRSNAISHGYLRDISSFLKFMVVNDDIADKLNSTPHIISFKNGAYDLKQKEFRERDKYDYCTFCLDYDYSNEYDNNIMTEIKAALLHTCNDDINMFGNMTRWAGYCLIGEISLQKCLFYVGDGSNGKFTLTDIFASIFDKY